VLCEISVRSRTPNFAEKVLDAAARLFGSKRFHQVRMEDVAAEAAVSKGTLYRYFHDKEQMYLALLERASRQLLKRLQDATASASGSRARLVAFIGAVIEFFDEQPHVFDLIIRAEALRSKAQDFPWQKVRDEGVRMVGQIFAEARRQGEFEIRDPELGALLLLGGMRAVIRFGRRPRPRHLARRIVDSFLDGALGDS
jgi:TetR/AcrR family fatty acid metabolism transcriptional regulator